MTHQQDQLNALGINENPKSTECVLSAYMHNPSLVQASERSKKVGVSDSHHDILNSFV